MNQNEYLKLKNNDDEILPSKINRDKYFNVHTLPYSKNAKIKVYCEFISVLFLLGILYLLLLILFNIYRIKRIIYEINFGENEKIENKTTSINIPKIKYNISSFKIKKQIDEEYKDIQNYIYKTVKLILINSNKTFSKINNPKISVIIPIYNGEKYINTSLISIENQDFNDIEIIIVDDGSQDNSVNLIKELMIKDPRIILFENERKRGILYSKVNGILNAKGKYVMTLDENGIYVQEDAFTTLYKEAEKENLDILGFSSIESSIKLNKGQYIQNHFESSVLFQPYIMKKMYDFSYNYKVKKVGDITLFNYLFKTELIVKAIKEIDDRFLNKTIDFIYDSFIFFLVTRKAYNLKQIKRIFYIKLKLDNDLKNATKIENEESENNKCFSYINYIDFLLTKTDNNILDKKIASFELNNLVLRNKCRKNILIIDYILLITKSFLQNDFIENEEKNKILIFLNETNSTFFE